MNCGFQRCIHGSCFDGLWLILRCRPIAIKYAGIRIVVPLHRQDLRREVFMTQKITKYVASKSVRPTSVERLLEFPAQIIYSNLE